MSTDEFDPLLVAQDERTHLPREESHVWPYRLAFLEFDDHGLPFYKDDAELRSALKEIARAKEDAKATGHKAVVALFVHGWKNNASDGSGNVWGFRKMLAGLSHQFGTTVKPGEPWRAPVVGIYVGWRGSSIEVPVVEQFTFWDREHESQRLPKSPNVINSIKQVMEAAKGADFSDEQTLSILIGHSFGGAVLEGAVTPTLTAMVNAVPQGGELRRAPANLIVLVNEAQEAMLSFDLVELMSRRLKPQDHCKPDGNAGFANPIVLSVSSTGDYATRIAFPFGQVISRFWTHLERYPQPNDLGLTRTPPSFFNTTAHMGAFQSHVIEIMETSTKEMTREGQTCTNVLEETSDDGISYLVAAKPGSRNHTGYWVAHMPPAIVPDHSTIFTPIFRDFLISFLVKTIQ